MFFIRKLRLAVVVCIVFHQCGIPHRTCRFYCCLAAHQRTKEKDSAEPLSSILWTPPPHPGVSAAAGHFGCRGGQGYSQLVSGADCLSPLRHIDWLLGVRAWTVRVSVDFVWLVSFVFHYWWDRLFVPAATVGFAMVFRRICADREWVDCFIW